MYKKIICIFILNLLLLTSISGLAIKVNNEAKECTNSKLEILSNIDTIIVPDDYPTIQEAIDNASNGDTVFVKSGTYYEYIEIDSDKNELNLIGENRENTIIISNRHKAVINVFGSFINISGFTLKDGWFGFYFQQNAKYNSIFNNIIMENVHWGISMYYSDNNNILDNYISLNKGGILITHSNKVTISNNTISHNLKEGIHIQSTLSSIVSDNTIYLNNLSGMIIQYSDNIIFSENNISDNNKNGINFLWSKNNTFSNNIISNNLYAGIHLYQVHNNVVNNNIIFGNIKGGIRYTDGSYNSFFNNIISDNNFSGLYMLNVSNNVFTNNTLSENSEDGILLYGVNNTVSENTILNNINFGIYLLDSRDNIFKNNSISENNDEGIFILNSTYNIITNNTISENNERGIFLRDDMYNTISGNIISYNNDEGIYIWSSSKNTIYHNNFIKNKRPAYIYYENYGNIWDNGKYGNYWDDYKEQNPFAKDKNKDGVWDIPYMILGGGENNTDFFPLAKQWPDSLSITIPKSKPYIDLFPCFFENHPFLYQLIQQVLEL